MTSHHLAAALTMASFATPALVRSPEPRDTATWATRRPGESLPVEKTSRYRLHGRVRPLLAFWIGRDDVGRGSIVWRRDGEHVAWELLIGTDPDRAPRRLNRWGFIAEDARASDGATLAVMSRSDERSLDQVSAAARQGTDFVAIRMQVDEGVARSVVSSIGAGEALTYRDAGLVVRRVQTAAVDVVPRAIPLPAGSQSGFLAAVAELIHASTQASVSGGGGSTRLEVPYVYGARLYDLCLCSWRTVDRWEGRGRVERRVIEGRFEIRSRTTGNRTRFDLAYATSGALAEVPLAIRFRPRWWLEIELELDEPVGDAGAARDPS